MQENFFITMRAGFLHIGNISLRILRISAVMMRFGRKHVEKFEQYSGKPTERMKYVEETGCPAVVSVRTDFNRK